MAGRCRRRRNPPRVRPAGRSCFLRRGDLRRSLGLVSPPLGAGRQLPHRLRHGTPAAHHLQHSLAGAPPRAELDLPAAGHLSAQAEPDRRRPGHRSLGQRPCQLLLCARDRAAFRAGGPLVSQGGGCRRGGAPAQSLWAATLRPRLPLPHRYRSAGAHWGVSILRFSQCRFRADRGDADPRGDWRHVRPDREAPAPLCARHPDHDAGPGLRPCPAALRAAPAAHRQRGDHQMAASARALPLCALLLLPIANAAITRWLRGTGASACQPRKHQELAGESACPTNLSSFLAYSVNLRALDARFCGLALAPFILLAAFRLTPAAGFPPDQFPVAAYSHIPAAARLFAPDKFGGYLIYRSNGTLKVFFDGRSDLYGADFLRQYARLVQVRPGWRRYWESFHFTHALVPADAPLLPALEQIGWRPLYQDKTATLLVFGGT